MLDASDWRALYPFASHFLPMADGVRMHYLDEGEGPPLLFVHGNPTWSFYWRRLVAAFRDRTRCVAPDHVGCGLSDKPGDYPYTLAQRRDDLVRLIEHLDLKGITLLAHDWGGAIGLGAALATPDRFARLVLFNTGAFRPWYIPPRIRVCRTPVMGRAAVQGLNLFARAALSMAAEKPERLTPAIRAGLLYPYGSWADRRAIHEFVADIPVGPRHRTWRVLEDIETGLPRLAHLPAMLIWGMRDWCFRPDCLERFVKVFPQAAVHRLEDCGHYVVEDGHERIIPLLEQFVFTSQPADVPGKTPLP
jgi:cis-3-alkyl-4-acyloxetan-2-one decarboxylase